MGAIDERILLVGHSSGAVVALESLVDMPAAFAGAVLYDPPIPTASLPFGVASTERSPGSTQRAQAALANGRTRQAFAIFAREILKLPAILAQLWPLAVVALPRVWKWVPSQIADAAAIEKLGDRLDTYAGIEATSILVTGERGQGDLHKRLTARWVSLPKQGHSAHRKAPNEIARVIEELADQVPQQDSNAPYRHKTPRRSGRGVGVG